MHDLGKRGEPPVVQHRGRILEDDVGVAEAARGVHQHQRPLAERLVGDPVAPQSRVLRLRLHRSCASSAAATQ
jgi:hypothetical protein